MLFFVNKNSKIAGSKLDEAEQITNALKKDTPLFNYICNFALNNSFLDKIFLMKKIFLSTEM